MRLEPKSLISAISFGRGARAQAAAQADTLAGSTLQSLAAELHQSALGGVFEYPRNWLIAVRSVAGVLMLLAVAHLALVAVPAVNSPSGLDFRALVSWQVAGVVLGAIVAGAVSALLLNVLQSVQVSPEGLGVSEAFGWRRIPWSQIGVLRVMELPGTERYVVIIPFKGATRPRTPAPMLSVVPRLAGAVAKGERGVLITSDLKNFERLLQLIVSYAAHASGQINPAIESFVDEEAVMPVAQLMLEPGAALSRLSRHADPTADPYGLTKPDIEPEVVWTQALLRQALIATPVAVLLLVDVLGRTDRAPLWIQLVWAVLLLALGVVELPFIGKLVQAAGDLLVGSGQFKRAMVAYMEIQVPRALLILFGAALVGVGVPAVVAQVIWLGAVIYTTVLLTSFVRKLYFLPVSHALIASLGTFIYQVSLLALYFGVR